MKKFLRLLLPLICLVGLPLFSACQDPYEGMKVEVDKTSAVIYLGQTPDNEITVTATVSGSEILCESIFSSTSNKIQITTKYLGDGKTQATIKGIEPCLNSEIKVQTKENNKVTYFNVSVVQPVSSLQLKSNSVNYGIFDESEGKTKTEFALSSSLFNFIPENTTQTDLTYQLLDTFNPDDVSLEENILTVKNSKTVLPIRIRAISLADQNVFVDFTYTVLPSIQSTEILIDEEAISDDKTLEFIKNNIDKSKHNVSISLNQISGYPVKIKLILNTDTVVLTNSSSLQSGSKSTNDYVLSAGLVGKCNSIKFIAYYENFDQVSNTILELNSLTYEEVKSIILYRENNQNEIFEESIKIYNQYSSLENDVPGLKMIFEAYPTSIPDANKKLLLNINELQDDFYFYDANKNELPELSEPFEISSGNYIYIKAKNTDIQEKVLTITAKDYPTVVKQIKLVRQVGVSELKFKSNEQEINSLILTTNDVISQEVVLEINENAEFGNVLISQVGNSFTYNYDKENNIVTISSVKDSSDENGSLTFTFENYFSKTLNIQTFKQLTSEDLKVTTETSLENPAVSVYVKNSDNSVNTVIIKNGNSIKLNVDANDAKINSVSYSFKDIETLSENYDYSNITIDNASTGSNIISIFDGYITSTSVGYTKVFVVVEGFELKDGQKQLVKIEKSFLVEVYNPLISLELEKYQLSLYSQDSLSAYDENLYEAQVAIKINGESAPKNLNYVLDYSKYVNDYFKIEMLSNEETKQDFKLKVTAFKYEENSSIIPIVVSITEKFGLLENNGITLQKRLNVEIVEATKLNMVEVTNVSSDGIYIDLTTSNTSLFQILTKIYPLNALNSNLRYTFIPDIETDSSILSVDNNGLIKLSSEKLGGTGYIRIVPEDCYKFDENNEIYEDFRGNANNLVKLIRIYIADGKSEKTAKRIYDLNEIKNNPSLHYSLIKNVVLTKNLLNEDFTGGLYGNLNGSGEKVTITLNNCSLFNKLTENAIVKNLSIVGTTENNGFVCSINNGKIINVSVDANLSNGRYDMSILTTTNEKAGGIAGENNGEISSCEFNGSIVGTSYAGGITSTNNGLIENCKFNVYNYVNGYNTITANSVGVIATENTQNGEIKNCVAVLYSTTESDFTNILIGTEIAIFDVEKKIEEPIDIDFSNVNIGNTENSIQEKDGYAILFYYVTEGEVLSSEEKNIVNSWNVIDLKTLFGNGYDSDALIIASNDTVTATINSIIINKTGEVTLTIFNRTNYTQSKTLNVLVTYPIREFVVSYDGYILGDGASLKVKSGTNVTFNTIILSQRMATNRYLKLKTNTNLKVNNYASLGAYSINVVEDNTIEFKLSIVSEQENIDNFNEVLGQNTINVQIETYKGAEWISVNSNSISFEPYLSGNLHLEMLTDVENDDIIIQIKDSFDEVVYDSNAQDKSAYDFNLIVKSSSKSVNDKWNLSYDIEILIKEQSKFKDFDENGYKIYINAKSLKDNNNTLLEKVVDLVVEKQSIKRVEFLHYLLENNAATNSVNGYSSEPVNTVTPGDVGLLNISLFPLYSKFDYITITSPKIENNQLSLRLLNNNQGVLSSADINVFTKINDGFRLEYNTVKNSYQTSNIGNFFIRTIVSSEVNVDVVFKIYVNVYVDEDVYTYEYNLTTRYLQKPTIFVNGENNYTYVAKGTFNDVSIFVPKTQSFDITNVLISSESLQDDDCYFDEWEIDSTSSSIYDIYKTKVFIGNSDTYQILANVSWIINNKLQTKTEVFNVYALDFVVNSTGSSLAVDTENKYYLSSYIDIATQLNIDLSLIYSDNYESQIEKLLNNNYFIANYNSESSPMLSLDYIVNYFDDINYANFKDEYINPLRNLYFVNGSDISPVFNIQSNKVNENPYISFEYDRELNKILVKGKATGIQNLRYALKVRMPNGQIRNIEFDFEIEVKVYTDEDTPRVIASVADFINIQNEKEAQDYILINDIILEDFVPFETSKINTLDGNNKTIHIRSFDIDLETTDISLALFSEVTSNTLLKNVTVNYSPLNTVEIDNSKVTNINFAGFAVTNNGLISNCEVVAYPLDRTENNTISGLNIRYQYENMSINSTLAGFVINNGATGSITNSRVGGDKIQKVVSNTGLTENITLKSFRINGQGNIAGFVYENNGLISSSFVSNTYIENTSTQNYDSLTAGFVVYNRAGHIDGSYVKGVANNSTEIHLSKYGITSLGISAGFVYQNSAKITDSYSNIKLTNNNNVGRASAGFVYINDKNGSIYRSFSASLIKNATTTQMNFSGVGSNQEYLNEGIIENSYYFDENVKYNDNGELETDSIEEYFDTPAIRIETINDKELYYGLSFAYDDNQNGIWNITNKGPELISANNIAISSRYLIELDEEKYVLPYVTGFDYGSINNPILIRTAEEFNEIFGNSQRTPIQNYYNLDSKIAFGSYRLVNNLDFSSFSSTTILNSSLMTLTATKNSLGSIVSAGMLDGNGFTISNVSMTANNSITDSFGLFKEIKDNAIVKNLNIIVGKIDEYSNVYGVTAGDTATVGTLAGKLTNASLSNITVYANVSGVIVAGQNIVGGLVGKVYNPINLTNLSAINLSVKAYQTSIRDYVSTLRDEEFSYAGGLFGIVSNDAISSITENDVKEYTPEFKTFKVFGASSIEGGIVGGVIGYVGKGMHIQDIQYVYNNSDKTQKITAYDNGYAGGVVGLLEGLINQSRSEYSNEILDQIEANVFYYYTQGFALEGDKELFYLQDYSPKYVGGLVGYMKNLAEIFRSYSKLNVINLNADYAGGLVGYADNFVVSEAYVTGDVDALKNVGGLVGAVKSSLKLSNVNALNVWNKNNIATLKTKNFGSITGSSLDSIAINCEFNTVNLVGKVDNTNEKIPTSSDNYFVDSIDQTFTYVDTKQNIIDFAEYVFKISDTNFNPDKWEKDDNNLYLDMRFIVKNNVYFINIAEDLELIKRYPDATFIINDMIDCTKFSAENPNFQIEYFAGILKGRDVDKEYGFKNLNLNNPLFNRVVNAKFYNFTMQNTLSTTTNANAILVNNAKGIEITSLNFRNYTLSITDQGNKNIALVVANVESGNSNIKSLTLSNNKITISNANKEEISVGFVFGRANGTAKIDNINLVNNAKELSSSSNVINIGTSSNALNTTKIYAGLIVGRGNVVNITNDSSDNENNLISGTVTSNGKTSSSGTASYIGGLVGSASSLAVKGIETTQSVSVSGGNSYVGGIIGNLNNEFSSDSITLNNVNIDVNAESSSIGGLIGNFAGYQITFNNSSFVNKNVTITSKGKSSNIGGLIGSAELEPIEDVEMKLATAYIRPTIKLENTSGTINAGGIVGEIKNNSSNKVSLKGSYFDGNIEKSNSNKILANIGGLVGNATNVFIDSSSSYGNIYLTSQNVTKNEGKFSSIYSSAYVGGLVGYGDGITLKNGKSLTTIYNKLGTNVYENGQISAIIGKYENTCEFNENEYCNQINLVTEKTEIGTNKLYKEFASLASSYNFIEDGEKGNPIIVDSLNFEFTSRLTNQTTYYSLNFNENAKLISQIDIFDKNVFIVGNGIVIEQSGVFTNGLFKTIPENSVVSGISYRNINIGASYENDTVGAFASSNNGYIYACNTVGCFANGISVNSIYGNTNNIAGFVGNNAGFIAECFSSIDISSSKANVAGFVYENSGVIQSSYSTGAIYNGNNIEAFSSGTLIDCYTISQIYNENTQSKVLNIFGSSKDLTNTWYDPKATQIKKRTDYEKNTSNVSLSYANDGTCNYVDEDGKAILFDGNLLGIWENNNGINYGYPSLTAGAYKDQSYMQLNTLYKIENNEYYLIHNFGKLEQISTALNGNYMLAYDLDGTNIEFTQIAGSFTGKFDGSFKTISNLSTSGIFESNNGTIKQLTLSNCLPNNENSALLVNKLSGGKIESIKVLYTKNIQITDKILSFGAIANQMSGGEIQSCIIDGTSIGSSLYELEFNNSENQDAEINIYIGGLVSIMEQGNLGTIKYSHSNIDLKVTTPNVNNVYLGGIVGKIDNGSLDSVSNNGNLTGGYLNTSNSYVGGISGFGGNISNAVNKGIITAEAKDNKINEIAGYIKTERTVKVDKYETKYYYAEYTKYAYASGITNNASGLENCYNISKDSSTNIFGGYENLVKPWKITGKMNKTVSTIIIIFAVTVGILVGLFSGFMGVVIAKNFALAMIATKTIIIGSAIGGVLGGAGAGFLSAWLTNTPNEPFTAELKDSKWNNDNIGYYYLEYLDVENETLNFENLYKLFVNPEKEGNVDGYDIEINNIGSYLNDKKIKLNAIYSDAISHGVDFTNKQNYNNNYNNIETFLPVKFNEFDEVRNSPNTLRNQSNDIAVYPTDLLFKYYEKLSNETYSNEINNTEIDKISDVNKNFENVRQEKIKLLPTERGDSEVYEILHSGHFYYLVDKLINDNGNFKDINISLKSNISLIGTIDQIPKFSGTFNGEGNAIYNINLDNNGLFKELSGATISMLELQGYQQTSDKDYSGFLASIISEESIVDNISLYNSSINATNVKNVGGLIGQVQGNSKLENSVVNAEINAYSSNIDIQVAGIAGNVTSTEKNTISNNLFAGKINAQIISTSKPEENAVSDLKITASGITNYLNKGSNSIENNINNGKVIAGTRYLECVENNLYYVPTNNAFAYSLYNINGTINDNALAFKPEKMSNIDLEANIISISNIQRDDDLELNYILIENEKYYVLDDIGYCLKIDPLQEKGLFYKIDEDKKINLDYYITITGTEASNYILEEVSYKKTVDNTSVRSNGAEEKYDAYQRETVISYINYEVVEMYQYDSEGNIKTDKNDKMLNVTHNNSNVYKYTYIEQQYKLIEYFDQSLMNSINISLFDSGITKKQTFSTFVPFDDNKLAKIDENNIDYAFIMLKEILRLHDMDYSINNEDAYVDQDNVSDFVNKCYGSTIVHNKALYQKTIESSMFNNLYEKTNLNLPTMLYKEYYDVTLTDDKQSIEQIDVLKNEITLNFVINDGIVNIEEEYITYYLNSYTVGEDGKLNETTTSNNSVNSETNTILTHQVLFKEDGSEFKYYGYLNLDELKETSQYSQYKKLTDKSVISNEKVSILENGNEIIIRKTSDDIHFTDYIYRNGYYQGYATYSIVILDKTDLTTGKFFVKDYVWTEAEFNDSGELTNVPSVTYVYYQIRNDFIVKYEKELQFKKQINSSVDLLPTGANNIYYIDSSSQSYEWQSVSKDENNKDFILRNDVYYYLEDGTSHCFGDIQIYDEVLNDYKTINYEVISNEGSISVIYDGVLYNLENTSYDEDTGIYTYDNFNLGVLFKIKLDIYGDLVTVSCESKTNNT